MNQKAVLGLDAAQAGLCFHLNDPAGRCLARGTAAKTAAGWADLNKALTTQGLTPPDCLVAIEATGDHHLPWCEALTQAGATVLALNPLVAKRTTPVRNAIRDHKADPIDAEGLACTAAREGDHLQRFAYHSLPARIGLLKLLAAYRAVRASLTNLKKHTNALCELVFPEAAELGLTQLRLRRLLQAAPTPARIVALSQAQLLALVGQKSALVLQAATDSFAPAALAEASAPALQALLGVIEQLEASLRALERQIHEQAAKAIPVERLALAQSLPGFGRKSTPVVLAFVPPDLWTRTLSRKRKVARIQALFGIDPRRRESGKWKGHIKLSKRGCRPARTALYQIALCSIVHDPQMRAYYQRLTKVEKKPSKVAPFDLARKHLRRLVAVLESGRPYEPKDLPAAA
jgi:transposase